MKQKSREQKYCVICKQQINENNEKWVRLTDFFCGTPTGEVYYHLECWRERFQITNSKRKQKMYSQAIGTIQTISNNLNKEKVLHLQ